MIKEFELTEDQKGAMKNIVTWYKKSDRQIFILDGVAGSGKTTILKIISEDLGIEDNTMFASFTGKASLVMKSKGITNTSTIHKLIYMAIPKNDGSVDFRLKDRGELASIKLIIIDESSMVSKEIIEDLLSFKVKILFVGDSNQLPPIGADKSMFDTPNFRMSEITRQSKESAIITLSQMVLNNQELRAGKYSKDVRVLNNLNNDDILLKADQILVSTNKARNFLNQKIRQLKGITSPYPVIGDKIICKKNNWELYNKKNDIYLLNGLIGTVSSEPREEDITYFDHSVNRTKFDSVFKFDFKVNGFGEAVFKDIKCSYDHIMTGDTTYKQIFNNKVEMINYGYAVTIHSFQGSSASKVLFYANNLWGSDSMKKKLLYTGITRSEKSLIMVI